MRCCLRAVLIGTFQADPADRRSRLRRKAPRGWWRERRSIGASLNRRSASLATASIRCSQLSSTSRMRLSARKASKTRHRILRLHRAAKCRGDAARDMVSVGERSRSTKRTRHHSRRAARGRPPVRRSSCRYPPLRRRLRSARGCSSEHSAATVYLPADDPCRWCRQSPMVDIGLQKSRRMA